MGSLQAHLDDCMLADFGQESHLGQHLHNLQVGLGSQLGVLDRDPGVLGSQPQGLDKDPVVLGSQAGVWGSHYVPEVLKYKATKINHHCRRKISSLEVSQLSTT